MDKRPEIHSVASIQAKMFQEGAPPFSDEYKAWLKIHDPELHRALSTATGTR